MSWFIIESLRITCTKYIVEAENEEVALTESDRWQYLGYVDGEDIESMIVGGAFETEVEAQTDIVSYIEG